MLWIHTHILHRTVYIMWCFFTTGGGKMALITSLNTNEEILTIQSGVAGIGLYDRDLPNTIEENVPHK